MPNWLQDRVAPAPLDLHRGQSRERPDAGEQLGVADRQHQHVVGPERQGMRADRRPVVRRRDHDRQMARPGIRLDVGQERHAALEPGVDQDDLDHPVADGGDRLSVARAGEQLAARLGQARTDRLERLARTLRDDQTSGWRHEPWVALMDARA